MTAEFTPYQEFDRTARASVVACAHHISGRLVLSSSVVGNAAFEHNSDSKAYSSGSVAAFYKEKPGLPFK